MRALADHYVRARRRQPERTLTLVFDIDGTILDLRHAIRHVLLWSDSARGTRWFAELDLAGLDDVHENHLETFLARWPLPEPERAAVLAFYREHLWHPDSILFGHRPYPGVMDVIAWFQAQPRTEVALNTGRPERIRGATLRSLERLGRSSGAIFRDDLLLMHDGIDGVDVANSKARALAHLAGAGRHLFAVVDNEPENLATMAHEPAARDALLLHADTIYETTPRPIPRSAAGSAYDLVELHAGFAPHALVAVR
jgi:phosphoglycolate phosphatase-like HAD superfamily hydrolase